MTEAQRKRILPTIPKSPTIIVIFGITGDLVRQKILRGIYELFCDNLLPPQWTLIGVGRREYTDLTIREYLRELMERQELPFPERYEDFLQRVYYERGNFQERGLYDGIGERLGMIDGEWKACSNKLYYLSIPPQYYGEVLDHLSESGITKTCSDEEGWTRVILEKPFGSDLAQATALDKKLTELFHEEQVYRVDHYLAKETVRNIIALRFSNQMLLPAWDNGSIAQINIRMSEEVRADKRGAFYDAVGALRDVGQNHLLQLLALFTMENPGSFDAEAIRQKRSEAMRRVHILQPEEIEEQTVRAQYQGYTQTDGVEASSQTETYFRVNTYIESGSFAGVPVTIEAGKALSDALVEVEVVFKHVEPCLCSPTKHERNHIRYVIQPDEAIGMNLLVKVPGHKYELESREFIFDFHDNAKNHQYIDPYALLFLDIIKGDQSLFVSTDEVIAQWEFVEPILSGWQKGSPPLSVYPPESTLDYLNTKLFPRVESTDAPK